MFRSALLFVLLGHVCFGQINNGGGGAGSVTGLSNIVGNTTGGLKTSGFANYNGLLSAPGGGTVASLNASFFVSAGGANDTYALFQGGTSSETRNYIAFLDMSSQYRWLIGKNAFNDFILYDATNGAHRLNLQITSGNSYLNSNITGAVIVNGYTGLDTGQGTGGFKVMGANGGTPNTTPFTNFFIHDTGQIEVTPFGETSAPASAALGIRAPSGHTVLTLETDAADSANPTPLGLYDSVGAIGGIGSVKSSHEGTVSTMQINAVTGRQLGLYINGSVSPALLIDLNANLRMNSGSGQHFNTFAANNDHSGTCTASTSTTCTVTFTTAYTATPACVATDQTNIVALKVTPSTTSLVITTASSSSDVFAYVCNGNPN